jgi:NCS2 family nucleobase:cation symporter-2
VGLKIKADVSFDEFNLDIDLRYEGMLMEFPTMRPAEADLLRDEKATVKLSGFIITQYVDTVKSELKDGLCRVHFHFDH